jgi:hypothetical protein
VSSRVLDTRPDAATRSRRRRRRAGHRPHPLIGVVGTAVDRADDLFSSVSTAVDTLSRTSRLLPDMLGRNGPRTYLVLVQNNAEWRSLGGIAGAGGAACR